MSGVNYLAGAVFLLLVMVPYAAALLVQLVKGWPNKPGYKKYVEALNPRRVYCLTLVVLQHLKQRYNYTSLIRRSERLSRTEHRCQMDISFGIQGNKLDLFYPPIDRPAGPPAPLIVFIYGGGWCTGSRSMYRLLARQMSEELKSVVICPDYCIYPKGTVPEMVRDVADCLVWAHGNAEKFNFDKDRIVLVGHSAGGHLVALTTLFLADSRPELNMEAGQQHDIMRSIQGVIGLSGIYNIPEYYPHEVERGVEFVSSTSKAMKGRGHFELFSPAHVLKKLSLDKLKRLPPFVLLHGTDDIEVPVEISTNFHKLLSSLSVRSSLHVLPNVDHYQMVVDLMETNRRFYLGIYSRIQQEHMKLLGIC